MTHCGLGGIRVVFGGNVLGWTVDRDRGFALLDTFYEGGGRMIDSAEGYSNWVPGNSGGESEAIIGAWLSSRGVRSEMRIATKTGMGGTLGALAPDKVAAALSRSLDRLQTDYVDLYYAHRDEALTPIDEVVSGFARLLDRGRVRELGASNFTAARFAQSLDSANRQGLTCYTVLQPGYNLVWRGDFSVALHRLAIRRDVVLLPYYALGSGFLTGKYRADADLVGPRGSNAKMFANAGWQALLVLEAVATECGATMGEIALAWLNQQPAVHAPIVSGTSVQQVRQLCSAAALRLNPEQIKRLNTVSVDALATVN